MPGGAAFHSVVSCLWPLGRARMVRMRDVFVYVDSSVWSCCFNENVADLQQQSTLFLDRCRQGDLGCVYVSEVVLQELASAPPARARQIGNLLRSVNPERLDLDDEATALAEAHVNHGVLTRGHLADAYHVAIATVADVDALVSWNYRHLVNRRRRAAFNGVNAIRGYGRIDIVSPPEVFDD